MRRIKALFLLATVLMVTSCTGKPSSTDSMVLSSDTIMSESSTASTVSDEIHYPSRTTVSKPTSIVAVVKDEAYYASLLQQMDGIDLWTGDSLKEKLINFSEATKIVMGIDIYFNTVDSLDPNIMIHFIRSQITGNDANRVIWDFDKEMMFYPEDIIDKYVYDIFNIKFDSSKLSNYAPEYGGIWCDGEGYGGGGEYQVLIFNDKGNGFYELIIKYRADETSFITNTYNFKVDGERIYIISIEKGD